MFINACADNTLPDTNSSVTINPSASVVQQHAVLDTSNILVADRDWGNYQTRLYSTTTPEKYGPIEKHKTHKIIQSIMSEYRKNKKQYKIIIDNHYSSSDCLSIKMNTILNVFFYNNTTSEYDHLTQSLNSDNPIFERCVVKFLNARAEEFMELIESETKKDAIESAKKEEEKIKEKLEIIEAIKNMEE